MIPDARGEIEMHFVQRHCTSVCHPGIDIMNFANKGLPMQDPECVRCSACVQQCPTGVLAFGRYDGAGAVMLDKIPASPGCACARRDRREQHWSRPCRRSSAGRGEPLGVAGKTNSARDFSPPFTGPFRSAFRRSITELETKGITVETPLAICGGTILAKPIVLVPILRAGLGMLDGIQRIAPDAAMGHIGLYRDAETLRPVSYYDLLPVNVAAAEVQHLYPMLATGNSATEAASILKAQGATSIQFLCIVACPAGVEHFQREHPDIPIFTAAIDPQLDDHGYIVPGLGDAGDRYFGTG